MASGTKTTNKSFAQLSVYAEFRRSMSREAKRAHHDGATRGLAICGLSLPTREGGVGEDASDFVYWMDFVEGDRGDTAFAQWT